MFSLEKGTDFMYQYGVDSSLFDKNELHHGLAAGVVIFAIWYFIRSAVVSLLFKVIKQKTVEKVKTSRLKSKILKKILLKVHFQKQN